MKKNRFVRSLVLAMSLVLVSAAFAEEATEASAVAESRVAAEGHSSSQSTAPSAVGSWFGIARPCPADKSDSPVHAAFCQAICGTCSSIPGTLPPEVPMMPIMLADGTVGADDAGEIGRYHTTAWGHWVASAGDGLPDWTSSINGETMSRAKATFFWLGSAFGSGYFNGSPATSEVYGTCCFNNVVRPRFVAYFDPANPNEMIGFIQPYAVPTFVDASTGLVKVLPYSGSNTFEGNHIPVPQGDLIGGPLPAGCQNNLGCLGTYHFIIRRIQPN